MSSQVLADIQQWAGYAGSILEALAGKVTTPIAPASPTTTPSSSLTVGLDPLPEVSAGLTAAGKISDLILAYEQIYNSPQMQQACEDEKIQAFKDMVNQELKTGDEEALEKLESQS